MTGSVLGRQRAASLNGQWSIENQGHEIDRPEPVMGRSVVHWEICASGNGMLRELLLCVHSLDLTDRPRKERVGPGLEYTSLVQEVGIMINLSLTSSRNMKEVLQNKNMIAQPPL